MQKCEKFAKFEKIDEMDDKMDDKKWKDMKGEDFDKKMDFWQKKYMAWEKDEDKMKALVCFQLYVYAYFQILRECFVLVLLGKCFRTFKDFVKRSRNLSLCKLTQIRKPAFFH